MSGAHLAFSASGQHARPAVLSRMEVTLLELKTDRAVFPGAETNAVL